ncbi:carbonic anhydrase [Neolewinella aurantiaca]|uniref:Carbonic anhydrase n=1 Tax=Neolewinella aurantiaca TaxID=2602767 RepID=A0A5C7FKC4_9BACT|nr:carbonic anhydrase family protein [Neolewinella aurantiaca]TXF87816.1 carbonic anhydrase [Neolewinella aurantiaca]
MHTQTKETQAQLTPEAALRILLEGNKRFLSQSPAERHFIEQVNATAEGQYPFACVLSCIDSRVPAELVFDQGVGDLFSIRIAGNFINDDILGSLEFGCKLAGSMVIMVLGHTSCGGVKGACDNAELGHLTQMLDKIKPAVDAVKTEPGTDRSSKNKEFVDRVAEENVRLNVKAIPERSSVLKGLVDEGKLIIVGAMYDVSSGKVTLVD